MYVLNLVSDYTKFSIYTTVVQNIEDTGLTVTKSENEHQVFCLILVTLNLVCLKIIRINYCYYY
jgi:hypothetical protein